MQDALLIAGAISSLLAIALLIFKPAWGLLAIFIVRPIVDTTFATPLLFGLKLTELVSSAVPLVILYRIIVDGGERRPFADMPLKWIWIIWSLDALIFSILIMFNQGWLDGLAVLMRHWNGLAGFYMVQAYCKDERDFRRFLWALAFAGLFPMATGVIEGLTGIHWSVTLAEGGVIRNIGLYHDAITIRCYALQTIMSLLLLMATSKTRSMLLSAFCCLYGIAAAFVIKGAYSKSGFLTLGAWLLLWPLLQKKFKTLAALGAGALLVGVYYSKEIWESVGFVFVKEIAAVEGAGAVNRTFAGRWYIWQDIFNDWQSSSQVGQWLGAGRIAFNAHNDYLQILIHGGLIGVGIYVLLLASVGWSIAGLLLKRCDTWAVAALLAFIMWMVDTIGLVPSAYSGYQWFVWGIIGYSLRKRQDEARQVEQPAGESVAGPVPRRFENLLGT
jgi:hypothetical protein